VQHPSHRRPGRRWAIALAIVAAVLSPLPSPSPAAGRSSDSSSNASPDASAASACDVRSVADTVLPSVVTISANGATGAGTGSGEVIRTDGDILTDLAVLKVDPPFDLTAIKIGQSGSVHVGQPVVALGAPLVLSRDGHRRPAHRRACSCRPSRRAGRPRRPASTPAT